MDFYALADRANMYDGFRQAIRVGRRSLLLIQDQGQHYIIENRCPHMDAPLASSAIANGQIICRAHGIAFSLRDGCAQGPLSNVIDGLTFFPVHYDGNRVGVLLEGASL